VVVVEVVRWRAVREEYNIQGFYEEMKKMKK